MIYVSIISLGWRISNKKQVFDNDSVIYTHCLEQYCVWI